MENLSDYQNLKEAAQEFYNHINSVFSPVLKERIIFSAEGFNHIIFKNYVEREKSSQILRFKLMPLAKKLIGLSTTYQEFEEITKEFTVKRHKKKIRLRRPVRYWGLIAIIDGRKIKVIIRKKGDNGLLHFWSVIPAWITSRNRDAKFFVAMRDFSEGD